MPRSIKKTATRNLTDSPSSTLAASQPEGWKEVVHRYVNGFNQIEVDRRISVLDGLVGDYEHRHRMEERLNRLHNRELMRGILAPQSEINAKLVRVHESPSEVSVRIELHIKRTVEHRSRIYTEERLEQERVWLKRESGQWTIVRIEPFIGERRPRFGTEAALDAMVEHRSSGSMRQRAKKESIPMPFLNHGMVSRLNDRQTKIPYLRDQAAAYADRWWNEGNPEYDLFEVNCTNYVSQCLFAGGSPMNYTGKRESGWWYKGKIGGQEQWSYSWAVSNALQVYLSFPHSNGLNAEVVYNADELQLGDLIMYDWNGDGRYQHTTIVTAFDADGMPLVNANTVPSRHRYWDYKDSYAWTDKTRYRFYHIL